MNCRKRRFSLVELMVATAILLILMTILFQIVGTMMKGWQVNQSSGRVYERAQLLFDQLNRDFTSAMAGTQGGRDIDICWKGSGFSLNNEIPDPGQELKNASVHLVSFNPNDPTGEPVEVHYRLDTEKRRLMRNEVTREDGDAWDFIAKPYSAGAADSCWCTHPDSTGRDFPFADGVCEFNVKVSRHNPHQLPDLVLVTLTLVDPDEVPRKDLNGDATLDWHDCASKRTFSRLFFLGQERRLGGN